MLLTICYVSNVISNLPSEAVHDHFKANINQLGPKSTFTLHLLLLQIRNVGKATL